jgi:hypothetical protein
MLLERWEAMAAADGDEFGGVQSPGRRRSHHFYQFPMRRRSPQV